MLYQLSYAHQSRGATSLTLPHALKTINFDPNCLECCVLNCQGILMAAPNIIPARFDETKRSSARLPLRVPIVIKGTDANGKAFSEETHTVVINRAGAKIVTSQLLAPDSRIQVSVPKLKRQCLATVVWWSEKKGEKNEAGIDFDIKSGDFWDVQLDRKSTRLNSSHSRASRMPSSA